MIEALQIGWRFFVGTAMVVLLAAIPDAKLERLSLAKEEARKIDEDDPGTAIDLVVKQAEKNSLVIWQSVVQKHSNSHVVLSEIDGDKELSEEKGFVAPIWRVDKRSPVLTVGQLRNSMLRGYQLYSVSEDAVESIIVEARQNADQILKPAGSGSDSVPDGESQNPIPAKETLEGNAKGAQNEPHVVTLLSATPKKDEEVDGMWLLVVKFRIEGAIGDAQGPHVCEVAVDAAAGEFEKGCMVEGTPKWCEDLLPDVSLFMKDLEDVEIRHAENRLDFMMEEKRETFEALGVRVRGDVVTIGAPLSLLVALLFLWGNFDAAFEKAKSSDSVRGQICTWTPVMGGVRGATLTLLGFAGLPFFAAGVHLFYSVMRPDLGGDRAIPMVLSFVVGLFGLGAAIYFRRKWRALPVHFAPVDRSLMI